MSQHCGSLACAMRRSDKKSFEIAEDARSHGANVLAHGVLCLVGVARTDRIEHGSMLFDRLRHSIRGHIQVSQSAPDIRISMSVRRLEEAGQQTVTAGLC
jgi:hypothetical protein